MGLPQEHSQRSTRNNSPYIDYANLTISSSSFIFGSHTVIFYFIVYSYYTGIHYRANWYENDLSNPPNPQPIGIPTLYQLSHPVLAAILIRAGWFLPQRRWS